MAGSLRKLLIGLVTWRQGRSPQSVIMGFRSHVARSFDWRAPSNVAVFAIGSISLAIAAVMVVTGRPLALLWAPIQTFVLWAWLREVDPDHGWTAVASAVVGAVWVLSGQPIVSAAATLGLMVASRVVVRSTGRRPLTTDIIGMTAIAVGVGYTTAGWIGGLALAIALFLDDRLDDRARGLMRASALIAAMGVTVTAAIFDVLPKRPIGYSVPIMLGASVVGLLLIARPVTPSSLVDARHKSPLDMRRLRLARALAAVSLVAVALLLDDHAADAWPWVVALSFAVMSNEITRARDR
jgi:hypothetical protein